MTNQIPNRDQLVSSYVDRIIDSMSTKDLMRLVGDQLEENLSMYSDEELLSEIEESYPELLQDWNIYAQQFWNYCTAFFNRIPWWLGWD